MIGISNFNRRQMAQAVKRSAAKIVTNQVEYHPLIDQQAVREAAAGHGIVLTAYASIARGAVLDHPAIVGIASAHAVIAGGSGAALDRRYRCRRPRHDDEAAERDRQSRRRRRSL